MSWVATKCTLCGGQLEVNTDKEHTVCPYCNMAFVNEKAINNYSITIKADVANVIGVADDGKALLTRID